MCAVGCEAVVLCMQCRPDTGTVQPKNNARARTSFCVRKKSTSCGFLRVGFTWFLQATRSSLRLEVKTARTSLRPDF